MSWTRTQGLAKSIGSGVACAASCAFYIPWVLGAAACVAIAGSFSRSGEAFTAAATIAASPAILFGEALMGIGQFVTGKKMSVFNLANGTIFGEDTNKHDAHTPELMPNLEQSRAPEKSRSQEIQVGNLKPTSIPGRETTSRVAQLASTRGIPGDGSRRV